jgi:hypothetical protein
MSALTAVLTHEFTNQYGASMITVIEKGESYEKICARVKAQIAELHK